MIRLETLSGKPYENIYLNETDSKYSNIMNHILKTIKRPYPELYRNKNDRDIYTMYVNKTYIKLINFEDDISFDKEDSVLHISINYEYVYYKYEYNCGKMYKTSKRGRTN